MDTAAVVLALRSAATAAAHAKALDTAIELLVSTSSLATTQLIVAELTRLSVSKPDVLSRHDWVTRLKQAAAVCAKPASKAEHLGFALTQQVFRCLEDPTQRLQHCQQALVDCFNGNPHTLSGVLAAVESRQNPLVAGTSEGAQLALQAISPLFVRVLIGADESCQTKLVLLHALPRVAWQSGDARIGRAVLCVLVAALERTPRCADAIQSYTALVSAVIDLVVASGDENEPTAATAQLIRGVCELIVARVRFFAAKQVGVLQLLQLLARLTAFAPHALWRSRFLFACAHLLMTKCDARLETQLLLGCVAPVLAFGRDHDDALPTRSVYVECLVVPLVSALASHAETARPLLQLVMALCARSRFVSSPDSSERALEEDDETVHLLAVLRLVADADACSSYLATRFADASAASSVVSTGTHANEEPWLALVLGTLLFDDRRTPRDAAVAALERQVRLQPKFWSASTTKLLVSTLVFLVSHRPSASSLHYAAFLSRSLFVLASLAAGTTETMKIVLRLIKRMGAVAATRATALRLLFAVWERESRVYPRLEALLHDESTASDVEYSAVKVATIAALCARDAELGVEYVAQIQSSLEDARVSVVALAVDAIASLCRADCLDVFAALKILALKLRKKKIACADAPLFLERLCSFYTLGAAEASANKRQADKLLAHLWELALSDTASVRACAYEALNAYSLQTLGLCVSEPRSAAAANDDSDDSDDDDDAVTEDDVSEKLDELVAALMSEDADAVRAPIEKLLTRVLEHESAQLTAGSGRGRTTVSSTVDDQRLQQRVSAAATREAKKKFPTRREVLGWYSSERAAGIAWDAFLVSYEATEPVEYSTVKRKDKLVKLATQNVEDMEAQMAIVLAHQTAPWDAHVVVDVAFVRVQSLIDGWQAFMATYVDAVDELSALKLTIGANPEDGDAFFADRVGATLATLQTVGDASDRELLALVASGALAGQLRDCRRRAAPRVMQCVYEQIERTSSRLRRAVEEAKVFAHESQHYTAVASAVAAMHLSLGHRALDAATETATAALVARLEPVLLALLHESNHALVQAVAATAVGHWGWLCACTDTAAADDRRAALAATQLRVETVARALLSTTLRSVVVDESQCCALVSRVFSDARVGTADTFAITAAPPCDAVTWGALMGLARVLHGFARVERVQWLANVKDVLAHVWSLQRANVIGVALGPALLECVRLHVASAVEAEAFVRTSIERLETSSSALDQGFLALVIGFMLGRMPARGCVVTPAQVLALVAHAQTALRNASESSLATALTVASIANCFENSLGVCALGDGAVYRRTPASVVLALEPSDVDALVTCVRERASSGDECAQFALGSIAAARELFVVAQKKRTFDAEVSALPAWSLLFKALDLLRREQNGDGDAQDATIDNQRARLVQSLLSCLTATSAALPLLDFEPLVHRLVKRFCDADVTAASVQFALTQGVCDVYVVDQLYSREALASLPLRVQRVLVTGVAALAARVAPATLERVASTVADVVLTNWRSGPTTTERIDVIDAWLDTLAALLAPRDASAQVSPESRDVVTRVVVAQMLPLVPVADAHDRAAVDRVRRFARDVLAHIPRTTGVDAFVLSSASSHGAQHAAMLVELLSSGNVFAAERQTAVVTQWVVQQDFAQWTDASAAMRVQLLRKLAAFVPLVGPDGSLSSDAVSWLLDVVHAFRRAISDDTASAVQRHALFTFVASVCSWPCSLSFEHASHVDDAVSPCVQSFAVGFLKAFGASERARVVIEELFALLSLVEDAAIDIRGDAIDYDSALRAFARHAHIVADARATQSVKASMLQFWSMDGFA